MIGLEIKIVFELVGTDMGRRCDNCEKKITGEIYQGIIQFGTADRLDIKALNLFICAACKDAKTGVEN